MNETQKTIEGAGPFLYEGGERAALLIHGFTGTADEMSYLGRKVADAGYTARLPLLPGHGIDGGLMRGIRRGDWIKAVRIAYDTLAAKHGPPAIIGLSMGGVLAADAAGSFPGSSSPGLVLLAAPLFLSTPIVPWALAPLAGVGFLNKLTWSKGEAGSAIADPEEKERAISSSGASAFALAELFRLMKEVKPEAVKIPTMLIFSEKDPTVPYANLDLWRNRLGAERIEALTVNRSHHVISRDYDKELVAESVVRFLGSLDW